LNELLDKGKAVSAWKRGDGDEREEEEGKGGGGGKGGAMTQSLYAHMNKGNKKKKQVTFDYNSKH
jgi:hypothetical protein